MVTAPVRREVVRAMVTRGLSERRALAIVQMSAAALRYAKAPHHTMEFWLEYLAYTRGLATRLKLDIRTIDRALWQYSKARQPSGR